MSDGGRNIGYAHLAPALCGLLSYVMLGGVGRLAASAGASVVLVLVFGLWLCSSCCLPSAVSLGARGGSELPWQLLQRMKPGERSLRRAIVDAPGLAVVTGMVASPLDGPWLSAYSVALLVIGIALPYTFMAYHLWILRQERR